MKNLFFAMALILSLNVLAQDGIETSLVFVRVYDLQGNKIAKGKNITILESSLLINKKEESIEIPLSSIGSIKTKRAVGNNVLMGAAIGAAGLAIVGAATADPNDWVFGYTVGEGAASGALVGAGIGAAAGGVTALFKKSQTFQINGDQLKWNAFKVAILK